jgi:histidinol-phosphatase (PHP family)
LSTKHFDQHIHSALSADAIPGNTIIQLSEAAISCGLTGIAITDHLDPCWPDEENPAVLDVPVYESALTEAENLLSGRIHFIKGIELGFVPGYALDECEETVSKYPYDFVIGSVHSSAEIPVDYKPFHEGRTLDEILGEYYALLFDSMKVYKNYDVLGHINYIDRYTDEIPPESLYMPYIDEILKLAIADGKGIEVNTATFGRLKRSDDFGTPNLAILKHYKDIGGEIVTIGSDAHQCRDVGAFIENGEELLRTAGFEHFAFYKNRQPIFEKL